MNSLFTNYVVISKVIQSTIHAVQFSNYVVSKLKYCSACALGDNRNNVSLFTYFFFKGRN